MQENTFMQYISWSKIKLNSAEGLQKGNAQFFQKIKDTWYISQKKA